MSLVSGSPAPAFTLTDQHGNEVSLSEHRGTPVLVYFYPKASTPGCTTQSCGLRDVADRIGNTVIIGISPDEPAKLKKFDDKHEFGFTLASDASTEIAQAYGVWVEKKNFGKTYMGVQRSAFLIGGDGTVVEAWPKISPKDTPTKLLAALDSHGLAGVATLTDAASAADGSDDDTTARGGGSSGSW